MHPPVLLGKHGQAERLVFRTVDGVAGAHAEHQPPPGDDVDVRRELGEQPHRPELRAGHERPDRHAFRRRRNRGERRECLEGRAVGRRARREEVIEREQTVETQVLRPSGEGQARGTISIGRRRRNMPTTGMVNRTRRRGMNGVATLSERESRKDEYEDCQRFAHGRGTAFACAFIPTVRAS